MLTKSDGTLKLNPSIHIHSSQRSSSIYQPTASTNEFEKRITDIKSKLTQIKNTINCEIESSFNVLNNTNNTELIESGSGMVIRPTVLTQISNNYHNLENVGSHLNNNFSNSKNAFSNSKEPAANTSMISSSLDHFQNRLNNIKSNLNNNYQ